MKEGHLKDYVEQTITRQLNNLRMVKISIICFQSIRHSLDKCNLILRQL